jgi:hypothetical protein
LEPKPELHQNFRPESEPELHKMMRFRNTVWKALMQQSMVIITITIFELHQDPNTCFCEIWYLTAAEAMVAMVAVASRTDANVPVILLCLLCRFAECNVLNVGYWPLK